MKRFLVLSVFLLSACAGMKPLSADFRVLDKDRDNLVSHAEFVAVYEAREWRKIDVDGSGFVTPNEYARYPNHAWGE